MRKLNMLELGRPDEHTYSSIERIPVIVVLDNIRSGLNVGSVFRTCDAFRIEAIMLCGITVQPPHREILKTALGATQSVSWFYSEDIAKCLADLKCKGYKICGVEQTSESKKLNEFKPDTAEKYALIFGNEVKGISDQILPMLDIALEIPQEGTKHSLNVSVCAGIVIWEFYKALK